MVILDGVHAAPSAVKKQIFHAQNKSGTYVKVSAGWHSKNTLFSSTYGMSAAQYIKRKKYRR